MRSFENTTNGAKMPPSKGQNLRGQLAPNGILMAQLVHEARAAEQREVCGFLTLRRGYYWNSIPVTNAAVTNGEFAMDPDEQLKVMREHRYAIQGIYHSHPNGRKEPSPRDVIWWPPKMRYWIITYDGMYEWEILNGAPICTWEWQPEPALLDSAIRAVAASL